MARTTPPRPVIPDFDGANLVNLIPALIAEPGKRPDWLPAPLDEAAQVVLFVVDGLGWLQLQDRLELAPNLASMRGSAITSVVPSTTATALASLTTGEPPCRHGVVGYRVVVDGPSGHEVMNVLRWRTVSGDAREFVVPSEFQPLDPFGGHRVPVVSKSEFNGTGFTLAHQRGVPVSAWTVASSLAVEVRRLVAAGEPLVYAYYEGVDKVAHVRGFGDHYDAELVALDRIVGDLLDDLPANAALAVTADHGQVQVGERATALDPRVAELTSMLSGEARFFWLHAESSVEGLVEVARAVYGDEAWVVTRQEMERDGWFGGPLSPELRHRLGDVALIPFEPVGYLDPTDQGDFRLVCRHGSVTPDEMLVPLVASWGRLGSYD